MYTCFGLSEFLLIRSRGYVSYFVPSTVFINYELLYHLKIEVGNIHNLKFITEKFGKKQNN